MHSNASLQP